MEASVVNYPSLETQGRLVISVTDNAPQFVNNGFNQYPIAPIRVELDTEQIPVDNSAEWVDFTKYVYPTGGEGNFGGWVSVQFADQTVSLYGGYDVAKKQLNLS